MFIEKYASQKNKRSEFRHSYKHDHYSFKLIFPIRILNIFRNLHQIWEKNDFYKTSYCSDILFRRANAGNLQQWQSNF